MRTNSHKGLGFNELTFEDESGQEEVFLRAERDMNFVVLHDRSEKVNRNKAESVGGHKSAEIVGNQFMNVGGSFVQGIGPLSLTNAVIAGLGSATNSFFDMAGALTSNAYLSDIPPGNYTLSIDSMKHETVGLSSIESVGMVKTTSVGEMHSIHSGNAISMNAKTSISTTSEKTIFINAGTEFSIFCGKTKIVMKKDGSIDISGRVINLNGEEEIILKAPKINLN